LNRPRPPALSSSLAVASDVADDDALCSLRWAREWVGASVAESDAALLALLRTHLGGRPPRGKAFSETLLAVLRAAARWINLQAQMNRMRRTATTLPKCLFACRSDACAAARKIDGRTFAIRSAPLYPLPSCNAAECGCILRGLTPREIEERGG
jgi:hypothetical protein